MGPLAVWRSDSDPQWNAIQADALWAFLPTIISSITCVGHVFALSPIDIEGNEVHLV